MKILVSGATGLVGNALGKALTQRGHTVLVLTRDKGKAAIQCPFPHTAYNYDDLASLQNFKDLDGVINLAGTNLNQQRWNEDFKKSIYDSRINTTQQLVKLANSLSTELKAFISTSAVGYYGDTGEQLTDEDSAPAQGFLPQVCVDWEAPLQELKPATRAVVLRLGVVLSEKGGALAVMVPPIQAGVGGPLASGKQYMGWIDIDDLVEMFIFTLENNLRGAFNAVSPNPITNKEMTQIIADHLGVKAFLPVPYLALRAALGEMGKHIVESQRISAQKIQDQGFEFRFPTAKQSIERRVPVLENMQKQYIFEQWLPQSKDEIFPFFADAYNLERITPDFLNFKILSVSQDPVETGTIIKYQLKLNGIPINWTTLIQDWAPPHRFIDMQQSGPYKQWIHQHTFEDFAGGTLMTDQVQLELPLGKLGFVTASWKVLSDVQRIFNYRREVIYKLFSEKKSKAH